jgi:hypothetical protein
MNQFSSIFGQLLQIFPKSEFYSAVKETGSEKGAKGFTCWGQFVAMLFCQLGQARSLREICGGLSSCLGKLKHLGIETAPSKSTLSYANEKRPWKLYEKVFYQLLDKCRAVAPGKKKFRFKNKLFSLDASVIELCLSLFDWATFRQTKERSSSISSLIMTGIFLSLPTSRKGASMRSTSQGSFLSRRVPLSPWTGATPTMSSLPDGPKVGSSL